MDIRNIVAVGNELQHAGSVGADVVVQKDDCNSGWWFFGGLGLGIVGTLVINAWGKQMGGALKGSTKRRVAAW